MVKVARWAESHTDVLEVGTLPSFAYLQMPPSNGIVKTQTSVSLSNGMTAHINTRCQSEDHRLVGISVDVNGVTLRFSREQMDAMLPVLQRAIRVLGQGFRAEGDYCLD